MTHKGRILCLTSNFPRFSGDSTTPFVLHLCQDLMSRGWEVDVLAPHAPNIATEETLDGVPVERFRYLPERHETVCYQGGALVNLRKRRLEKVKLPALVLGEWLTTEAKLRGADYDLIHAHWILPQGFVGALSSLSWNIPLAITVHGGDLTALRSPWLERTKSWALERAGLVTVNSSYTRRGVETLVPNIATELIPMGVRVEPLSGSELARAESVRAEYGRSGGPLLLFVGRLVEEKGAEDVILALELLGRDLPHARLLVVGEGPERAALEGLVRDHGLDDRVVFTGWVQPEDIRAYMAAADVFVGPSRTGSDGWVEAQGLTFVEAMATGTAVVGTRLGGIVDAVVDGETGLLVDERRPDEIADRVRELVRSPDLRAVLSAGGKRLAKRRFSREASAAAFDDAFTELLGRGSPSEGRGERSA